MVQGLPPSTSSAYDTTPSTSSSAPNAGPSQNIVFIAVMGPTGTGKTTFVNTASGSKLTVGGSLESCTSEVQESKEFELHGRRVVLIDTPGFDDSVKSDVDVLKEISSSLASKYQEKVTLGGVIYMHRIIDNRMGGALQRSFRILRKLCGDDALQNVVIVTTFWGKVDREEGESRETQLQNKFFKTAIEKGARMCRDERPEDPNSVNEIINRILNNRPLPLQIQQELVDQEKTLEQTEAGKEVDQELQAQSEKYLKKIKELQQEKEEAIRAKDEEWKQEVDQMLKEEKVKDRKIEADMKKMKDTPKLWWALGGAAVGVGVGVLLVAVPVTAMAIGTIGGTEVVQGTAVIVANAAAAALIKRM